MKVISYTLKKCWVVLTQFWVKYGQNCWIKKMQIINLTAGFVHI